MQIRFFISPETGRPHVEDHGITTWECVEILERPLQDFASRNESRVALGQTEAGRFLKVIYSADQQGDGVFVITAYRLPTKQVAALRRRLRKRGGFGR